MANTALQPVASSSFPVGFEEVYNANRRHVHAVCLKMCSDPGMAEDLTHEVFLIVARKIDSFRGDSAFSTWLHSLTVNVVRMHFRKTGRRIERSVTYGDVPDRVDPYSINPERMPVMDRIALERAIPKLPRCYRMAFVLHDVEGYEHKEIAKMLSINIGTSKSNLHKARLKMRELLLHG